MSEEELKLELTNLKQQINELENKLNLTINLPKTNLLSEKFLTRAFAVLGHYTVAGLLIAIPFYILILLFAISTAH